MWLAVRCHSFYCRRSAKKLRCQHVNKEFSGVVPFLLAAEICWKKEKFVSFFQIESRIESQVVLGHGLGKMGGMEPRHFDVSSPFEELSLFFLFACCSLSFSFGESSTEDVKMQCPDSDWHSSNPCLYGGSTASWFSRPRVYSVFFIVYSFQVSIALIAIMIAVAPCLKLILFVSDNGLSLFCHTDFSGIPLWLPDVLLCSQSAVEFCENQMPLVRAKEIASPAKHSFGNLKCFFVFPGQKMCHWQLCSLFLFFQCWSGMEIGGVANDELFIEHHSISQSDASLGRKQNVWMQQIHLQIYIHWFCWILKFKVSLGPGDEARAKEYLRSWLGFFRFVPFGFFSNHTK